MADFIKSYTSIMGATLRGMNPWQRRIGTDDLLLASADVFRQPSAHRNLKTFGDVQRALLASPKLSPHTRRWVEKIGQPRADVLWQRGYERAGHYTSAQLVSDYQRSIVNYSQQRSASLAQAFPVAYYMGKLADQQRRYDLQANLRAGVPSSLLHVGVTAGVGYKLMEMARANHQQRSNGRSQG